MLIFRVEWYLRCLSSARGHAPPLPLVGFVVSWRRDIFAKRGPQDEKLATEREGREKIAQPHGHVQCVILAEHDPNIEECDTEDLCDRIDERRNKLSASSEARLGARGSQINAA